MKSAGVWLGLIAAVAAPRVAAACSGPNAAADIREAIALGYAFGGVSVVMLIVATVRLRAVRPRPTPLAAGWVLVAAHPGFWLSARGGDCGISLVTGAALFSGAAALVLLWSFWRTRRS